MTENLLTVETSPYLLQHKDNPVHWRAWGNEAFEEARAADKPILLSIGYAACHWCHVMAHESFENDAIADVMNELFVNIKVDREERPDVDVLYQSALAMMGQQGGWPLTMFLKPDGQPFWGGTYFPAESRFGRPAFPEVLRAVARTYREEPEKVEKNASALREGLAKLSRPEPGKGLNGQILDEVAATALRLIDPIHGGTAGAPKFPQAMLFRLLWRAWLRSGSPLFREAVVVSLDNICQGGIYDHVGGGFSRYATDVRWLVPHFEKMLYDNAQLVDLMTEVWLETGSPLYATRVRETIGWVLEHLAAGGSDGGRFGLASAFDADSEGVEGKYYVWSEAEIDRILGDEAAAFKPVYDLTRGGNWEGHTILNRLNAMALRPPAEEAKLRGALNKLATVRTGRVPPQRDDKVLADWNGLMITALARASSAFAEPAWLDAARAIFRFVAEEMAAADGRLYHAWCAGQARHPAVIDDYANLSQAALVLFEVTGERSYLERAVTWVEVADRHYWDPVDGGYFLSANDTTDVLARTKPAADHATPAGNGTMLDVLARLWMLTGDDRYRERCERLITLFSGDQIQYLIGIPGLLCAYELLEAGRQVVIIGDPAAADTAALRTAALTWPGALRVVAVYSEGERVPEAHPAAGKTRVDGVATAYVCAGPTCGLPATDAETLRSRLAAR